MSRHRTSENHPAPSPHGHSLLRQLTGNRGFVDFAFRAAVVMKAIYGAGEVTVGILLALIGSAGVNDLIATITAPALAVNPNDIIASTLVSAVAALTSGLAGFVVVYLIAHGTVKIVLLWALVTRHPRVYPWAIILLTGFVVYQIVEIVVTFSLPLLLLTIVDIVIITLTFREWRMTGVEKNQRDNERDASRAAVGPAGSRARVLERGAGSPHPYQERFPVLERPERRAAAQARAGFRP